MSAGAVSSVACPDCRGTGRVGAGYLREDCPPCGGTGKVLPSALESALAKLSAMMQIAPKIDIEPIRPHEAAALLAEMNRLAGTLAAVERARDIEHRARRSLQQALKELCAQHIGGEL